MYALRLSHHEVNSLRWASLLIYENTIALFGWSSLACPQILEMWISNNGNKWSHVIYVFELDLTHLKYVSLIIYLSLKLEPDINCQRSCFLFFLWCWQIFCLVPIIYFPCSFWTSSCIQITAQHLFWRTKEVLTPFVHTATVYTTVWCEQQQQKAKRNEKKYQDLLSISSESCCAKVSYSRMFTLVRNHWHIWPSLVSSP